MKKELRAFKQFKECIGEKVICPCCNTNLLDSRIMGCEINKSSDNYWMYFDKGQKQSSDWITSENLEMLGEEYYCDNCSYEFSDFFEYLASIENIAKTDLSDEAISFINSVIKIREKGII